MGDIKIRILITADPEIPVPPTLYGGIERYVDFLIRGLRAKGHYVALIANCDSTILTDGFTPWPGKRSQNNIDSFKNIMGLKTIVNKFNPQIIHSSSRLLYFLPFFLMRTKMPIIMTYHRIPTPRVIRIGSCLGREMLTFVGVSEYICRLGKKEGGVWHRIYSGVELNQYEFQPTVNSDAPLIFLSRVERVKGVHTAIKVAERTGKRLIIAGNHSATEEDRKYWEEEIIPHLGKNKIEYIGSVNNEQKNKLLGQASAMIVPIEWDEPLGLVFIEALACGTPVISCPRGGVPEIVRHGIEGFLVQDIDEAINAVHNISTINRFNCRKRVEECFSVESIVDQYEQLYRSLVQ